MDTTANNGSLSSHDCGIPAHGGTVPRHAGSHLDALLARPPAGITVIRDPTPQTLSLPAPAALLKAKIRLAMNRLMATYLSNWEETADQHDEDMGRLMDVLPPEHRASAVLADSFNEARFEAVRKHVLKCGNDECRDLEKTIDALHLNPLSPLT